MQGGDEVQIIKKGRTQITGKSVYLFQGFRHKPLSRSNIFPQLRCISGLQFQGRQSEIDSSQRRPNYVVQLPADLLSFLLLREDDSMRHAA